MLTPLSRQASSPGDFRVNKINSSCQVGLAFHCPVDLDGLLLTGSFFPRAHVATSSDMTLKLRLARFGRRNSPFYNIVVAHARFEGHKNPPRFYMLRIPPGHDETENP